MNGGGQMQMQIRKVFLDRKGQETGETIIEVVAHREKGEVRFGMGLNLYLPESSLNRDMLQLDGTSVRWELATQEDVEKYLKL